jgi:hypothetical protein
MPRAVMGFLQMVEFWSATNRARPIRYGAIPAQSQVSTRSTVFKCVRLERWRSSHNNQEPGSDSFQVRVESQAQLSKMD